MRRTLACLLLSAASGAALAAPFRRDPPKKPPPLVVTEKANGREIRLDAKQQLAVLLEVVPTTGYLWELSRNDPAALKPARKPRFEPPKGGPGSPGVQQFRFRPLQAGATELVFEKRRPFDRSTPPAATVKITVVVLPVDGTAPAGAASPAPAPKSPPDPPPAGG